jgi:hypothetical protein
MSGKITYPFFIMPEMMPPPHIHKHPDYFEISNGPWETIIDDAGYNKAAVRWMCEQTSIDETVVWEGNL